MDPFPHQEQNKELRAAVRDLCSKFDLDYWDRHDKEHEFPTEFFEAFAAAGYLGTTIPEEYGGGGGAMSDLIAVLEEVGASGGALNACSTVHTPLLTVPTLLQYGTEEQRKEFLPKIASGELFITFGVTEPDAGTDTTQIKTRAAETSGGYVVNGAKVWNTGALRGEKIFLLARTSTPADGQRRGEGLTLFLTDLKAPTIDIRPIPKIGRNALISCEVFFHDHFVPAEDVVGEVGMGFYHLLDSLNGERLYLAGEALGLARWALSSASRYAQERVVFGRPIGKNQAVQHPLAQSYLDVLAASEVVYRAVREYEEKGASEIGLLANAAKLLATEASFKAHDAAMQVFGGYSFAREYHIGRHWIESRLQRIAPVNNQMILNYVAERALGLERSY
ncbi:acyl-CoA dehydrogenase family protein [Rhodococcus sp. NCIMB 12038]|uniref:acyl-CoA dehydrogenase family protein n=1 Tax=Rhodococcus sp. NCIMB 12038 TaxID=933800 RepID=UPI000B3C5469|nr:acyl-CoA dehydrogenase family protein [Rhodococcus sp. NCIMB 12038]OUS92118.1 acyl-CoA dehydrogenase [Rhodococcus sp. NCIMB 12038]